MPLCWMYYGTARITSYPGLYLDPKGDSVRFDAVLAEICQCVLLSRRTRDVGRMRLTSGEALESWKRVLMYRPYGLLQPRRPPRVLTAVVAAAVAVTTYSPRVRAHLRGAST